MKPPDQIIADGGRCYAGSPLTRLFTVLALFGLGFLMVALASLLRADWPPDLSSGQFWWCVLMVVAELILIGLTVRFALTEKPYPRPPDPGDFRKLY